MPADPSGADKPRALTLVAHLLPLLQDREQQARFGAPPSAGRNAMMGGGGGFGGYGGGAYGGGAFGGGGMGMGSNQIYVGNVRPFLARLDPPCPTCER